MTKLYILRSYVHTRSPCGRKAGSVENPMGEESPSHSLRSKEKQPDIFRIYDNISETRSVIVDSNGCIRILRLARVSFGGITRPRQSEGRARKMLEFRGGARRERGGRAGSNFDESFELHAVSVCKRFTCTGESSLRRKSRRRLHTLIRRSPLSKKGRGRRVALAELCGLLVA